MLSFLFSFFFFKQKKKGRESDHLYQSISKKKTSYKTINYYVSIPLGSSVSKRTPVSRVQHRATFSFVYPPPPVTCRTEFLPISIDFWKKKCTTSPHNNLLDSPSLPLMLCPPFILLYGGCLCTFLHLQFLLLPIIFLLLPKTHTHTTCRNWIKQEHTNKGKLNFFTNLTHSACPARSITTTTPSKLLHQN